VPWFPTGVGVGVESAGVAVGDVSREGVGLGSEVGVGLASATAPGPADGETAPTGVPVRLPV
jgi:hypothetical protein